MKHIVALSGGKDSTAMALRLAETTDADYVFVCTPTRDELPDMQRHWQRISDMLPTPLIKITGKTLNDVILDRNSLPSWRMRFCTQELKIYPFQDYIEQHKPVTVYVGLRADEETREGLVTNDDEITVRHPLREWNWGIREVSEYLDRKGITIPQRTDCARCFYQTLYEWWYLWKHHPNTYLSAELDEMTFGHTYRSPQRDTQPTDLAGLRQKFEQGYAPKPRKRRGGCRICSM